MNTYIIHVHTGNDSNERRKVLNNKLNNKVNVQTTIEYRYQSLK